MHNASTSVGCDEIPKLRKIGYLVHFGETGDEPDTLIFYFQHSKKKIAMPRIAGCWTSRPQKSSDTFSQMVAPLTRKVSGMDAGIDCRQSLSHVFHDETNDVQLGTLDGHTSATSINHDGSEMQYAAGMPPCFFVQNDPKLAIVLDGYLHDACVDRERSDLVAHGVTFRSNSNAELLLLMYREYGVEFLKKLDGAFAFAIWDGRNRSFLLARDHLGQRPLVYYADREQLLFASELKAIRNVSHIPKAIHPVALQRYLFYQNIPEPLTIYEKIAKLEQGHYAIWHDGTMKVKRWWDYDFNMEQPEVSVEEWRERIGETLPKPINAAFNNKTHDVGTFLSGGVDSTIMTGLSVEAATRFHAPPVHTFSIGFRHDEYDESVIAKNTTQRLKTDHHEQVLGNHAAEHIVEILPQLAWFYDEPFADSSVIPVWNVMQLAAQTLSKNSVIFCGDGGDELFSGYLRHQAIMLASRLDLIPRPVRRLIGGPMRRLIPAPVGQKSRIRRIKRFLEAIGDDDLKRYSHWTTLFNHQRLHELLAPDLATSLSKEEPLECYEKIVTRCRKRDRITRFSVIDLLSGISNNAMVKVGVAASAFGVECRFPFLSREMVELAFAIPGRYKRKGKTGKTILRDTFRRFLPPELERHPKMGFGAPLDHWLRSGPLADHALEVLTDPKTTARDYFQQSTVERLLEEHRHGVFDHAYRIWALLMLEYWHRVYN
ncbi:MAG: asparagine synthase (glutamine-hydrolyzing) [Planctomycetaceae bacterium]|nr:asparagine synthase (glutamine-hydrolyzing) [Planctomycetaceae bacterium]